MPRHTLFKGWMKVQIKKKAFLLLYQRIEFCILLTNLFDISFFQFLVSLQFLSECKMANFIHQKTVTGGKMWLQRLHRHGDNSVNATRFSCNSLWWQCRGRCHDSIVLIFVLFLIRTAQNYLCPQSSVEDDAKEKGAMADHSFQASDVLHLQKKGVWIDLNKKVWSKKLYILSFLCFENKARVIRFDVSNVTKSNRNAKASHKQSVFLSETLSVRLYRFFIGFKHSHSSLNESFLAQTTFWVQSFKP